MHLVALLALLLVTIAPPLPDAGGDSPQARAIQFERAVSASNRLLHAWLPHADPRTLLLPDRPMVPAAERTYTPHNSGADLYPYLVLTAHLTDPGLYHGRMLEMLRNEIRYTTAQLSIPANL